MRCSDRGLRAPRLMCWRRREWEWEWEEEEEEESKREEEERRRMKEEEVYGVRERPGRSERGMTMREVTTIIKSKMFHWQPHTPTSVPAASYAIRNNTPTSPPVAPHTAAVPAQLCCYADARTQHRPVSTGGTRTLRVGA
eukprot:191241-Rhodomonas_salina.3